MTNEISNKIIDNTANTKPMDVVKDLPNTLPPKTERHNIIVKTANSPVIETNEYPITSAAIEMHSNEIHGNSKIIGCCSCSIFITLVNPTRNNKENGIAKNPNSI